MNGTQTLIDRATADVVYIGTAASGVATSQKQWEIKKLTYLNDLLISIQYAEGNKDAINEWDERTNYDYK